MNYASILPSNHFRTHRRSKREKEDPRQAKGIKERATQGQSCVHRRSSPCPLPVKLSSTADQAYVHCRSSLCPLPIKPVPTYLLSLDSYPKKERKKTHPSSWARKGYSNNPSHSGDPSLVLILHRSILHSQGTPLTHLHRPIPHPHQPIPHPHRPTSTDPSASILFPQDPLPFFSLKIWDFIGFI